MHWERRRIGSAASIGAKYTGMGRYIQEQWSQRRKSTSRVVLLWQERSSRLLSYSQIRITTPQNHSVKQMESCDRFLCLQMERRSKCSSLTFRPHRKIFLHFNRLSLQQFFPTSQNPHLRKQLWFGDRIWKTQINQQKTFRFIRLCNLWVIL